MANEGSISVTVKVDNGNYSYKRALSGRFDQTNPRGGNPGVVTIGTSETTISFGSLSTPRVALFQNLDDTNFVEIGPDSTGLVEFIKLLPGQFAVLPLADSVTVKAKADTAACDLLVEVQDA